MYMSICHYTNRDECTKRSSQAKNGVGVTAMRNRDRATNRWKAARGVLRSEDVVWREDDLMHRPAYFFRSSDKSSVYRVWDHRFLLSVAVTPCHDPGMQDL